MKLVYRKWGINFCNIWFNKLPVNDISHFLNNKVDIIYYSESHVPLSEKSINFVNGIIFLEQNIEVIFSRFSAGFRNEVRRAEKEGIKFTLYKPLGSFNEEYLSHINFCKTKHLAALSFSLLQRYWRSQNLWVSRASIGVVDIQFHFYFANEKETVLLASFPGGQPFESQIMGWANRALHWSDIKLFKSYGFFRYNLGGMGNPVTDLNRNIVTFKSQMSPEKVLYFHDTIALSRLGKFYLFIRKILF